jgi:hypothetical protein
MTTEAMTLAKKIPIYPTYPGRCSTLTSKRQPLTLVVSVVIVKDASLFEVHDFETGRGSNVSNVSTLLISARQKDADVLLLNIKRIVYSPCHQLQQPPIADKQLFSSLSPPWTSLL